MIVVQHEPQEGPGSLLPLLPPDAQVVRAWQDPIPTEARALLSLGGGMSANDDLPFLRDELRLMRDCISRGAPVLGICLGSQLLSRALGGTVARAARPEIGFYRVRLSADASSDPLFSGAPSSFVAFHWHSDAFTLPPGATPLASSTLTPLQAFRHGRAWGVQFHPEMNAELLRSFIATGSGDLSTAGVDPDSLLSAAPRELPRLADLAAQVFHRWLSLP
jgi:GMP synthase (glutamine-hydrolysing)